MTLGLVLFAVVFVLGLVVGTYVKRPFATACLVLAAFTALLVAQAHETFTAFAAFALITVGGLLVDSVRETVGILLGR